MARKDGVSHDTLQAEAEKLVELLKGRETVMFNWDMMVNWYALLNERVKVIHDLLCPLFAQEQHQKS